MQEKRFSDRLFFTIFRGRLSKPSLGCDIDVSGSGFALHTPTVSKSLDPPQFGLIAVWRGIAHGWVGLASDRIAV